MRLQGHNTTWRNKGQGGSKSNSVVFVCGVVVHNSKGGSNAMDKGFGLAAHVWFLDNKWLQWRMQQMTKTENSVFGHDPKSQPFKKVRTIGSNLRDREANFF
jgi:hypothetical protein